MRPRAGTRRRKGAFALATAVSLALGCHALRGGTPERPVGPPQLPPSPGPEAAAFRKFGEDVAAYWALRAKAVQVVPPLKPGADAAAITAREHALAAAIRDLRKDAKPGDLFAPGAAGPIARMVKEELAKQPVEENRVKTENPRVETPHVPVTLAVNAEYPSAASVSTVPSQLLLRLPPLPRGLEYRFVGRHLVLRDVGANLIVDYILDVVPAR